MNDRNELDSDKKLERELNRMGLGRPTKYKKAFARMLVEYFSIPATYEKEIVFTNKKGETYSKFETVANDIPTFEGFAESIQVDDRTLERWSKAKTSTGRDKHPEFCRAYNRAKQLQKQILIKNTLNGRYNSQFAMFYAKNVTDLRDRLELPRDDEGKLVPFVTGFNFAIPKGLEDGGTNNDKTDN